MSKVTFKIGDKTVTKSVHNHYSKKQRKEALKNRTKAELWAESIIRSHVPMSEFVVEYNFKFRRFDFYFPRLKIAIEIDGGYHRTAYQKEYDVKCDLYLYETSRIKVLRVNNFDSIALMTHLNVISKELLGKPIEVLSRKQKKKRTKRHKLRLARGDNKKKKKYRTRAYYPPLPVFKPRIVLRKKNEPVINEDDEFSTGP